MTFMPIMLSVWGLTILIMAATLLFRSRLTKDEEDQLFLDDSFSHEKAAQAAIAARAAKPPGDRGVGLLEAMEKPFSDLVLEADPCVTNREKHAVGVATDLQRNLAALGELHGVAEEVGKHLRDPQFVAAHAARGGFVDAPLQL